MVSETSFISKKIKEQGFLRNLTKINKGGPRSGKNSSRIEGVKGTGFRIRNTGHAFPGHAL
jgi:hypothetical protein